MDLPEVGLEVLADYLFEVERIRAVREEEIERGRIICGESPVDLSDFARRRVGGDGDGECTCERRGNGGEEAMYGKKGGCDVSAMRGWEEEISDLKNEMTRIFKVRGLWK
jgi:hypothetical protein